MDTTNNEQAAAIEIAIESNMLQRGHWRLASGLHSDVKANFDGVSENQSLLERTAAIMTSNAVRSLELRDAPPPDAVVGVPSGAEALANLMTSLLEDTYKKKLLQLQVTKFSQFRPVKFWVTDPVNQLKGVNEHKFEKLRILGIEDITTTWGSVTNAVDAVGAACSTFYGINTEVVALQCFAERKFSLTPACEFPKRLKILNLELEQVKEADCVSCRNGLPLQTGAGVPLSRQESEQLLKSGN